MKPCPACKGEGVVFLRYLDQREYARSDPDDVCLPCAECHATGQVAGEKHDEFIGYFLAELKAFHPRAYWAIQLAMFASVAAFALVDFAPLVLLFPVVMSIAFLVLSDTHDPDQFRSFEKFGLLIMYAWITNGAIFVIMLFTGPLIDHR